MAAERPPAPKAASPQWLQNAGVRADEFARQARVSALPPAPPPPDAYMGDTTRRRLVGEAGAGLNYQAVKAKSSPAELAHQTLAFTHARPASFAPQQHVFFVLGRPCVVLREKTMLPCAWLTLHTRAHRRETLRTANIQPSTMIFNDSEPESTTRLIVK